jgi:ATP-dependent exoDNAse (exonuclease V) beta subunit
VEQIAASVIDDGQRASDFAILYRTNAQSRLLEKALLARRIDYQLIGGFRFYHRQEIKDLLAYLRLVYNATDDGIALVWSMITHTDKNAVAVVDTLAKQPDSPVKAVLMEPTPAGQAMAASIPGNTTVVAGSTPAINMAKAA